jgi:hypothetical protein
VAWTTQRAPFLNFVGDHIHRGHAAAHSVGELLFVMRLDRIHRFDQCEPEQVTERRIQGA